MIIKRQTIKLYSKEAGMLSNVLSRGCRDIDRQLRESDCSGVRTELKKIKTFCNKISMGLIYGRIEIEIKEIK